MVAALGEAIWEWEMGCCPSLLFLLPPAALFLICKATNLSSPTAGEREGAPRRRMDTNHNRCRARNSFSLHVSFAQDRAPSRQMYTGHADDAADLIGDFQFSHTRSRLSILPQIYPAYSSHDHFFRGIKRTKKSTSESVKRELRCDGEGDIFDHSDRKEDAHMPDGLTDGRRVYIHDLESHRRIGRTKSRNGRGHKNIPRRKEEEAYCAPFTARE